MAPELLKKSIAISPLVMVIIVALTLALTIFGTVATVSREKGADSNQLKSTVEDVKEVMDIQIPGLDRRVGLLEQEMSASKMDRENIKKVMDRMDSRIEKMFDRQFPSRAKTIKVPLNIDDSRN